MKSGTSDYFITEACEYKESFLKFYPYIGVILNIDVDHLDYYRDIDHIQSAFQKFADKIPQNGYLVINAEDIRCKEVSKNVKCNVISYGINNGNLKAESIKYDFRGCGSFDVVYNDKSLFNVTLNVPGEHNILNALSTIAVSIALNIEENKISSGLLSFEGTHRRFEHKGEYNNIIVIDDYAHHPAELKAVLDSVMEMDYNEVWAVFQPFTFSRTSMLLEDFGKVLQIPTHTVLTEIMGSREVNTYGIKTQDLADKIPDSVWFKTFEEVSNYIVGNAKSGDLVITLGCGDIYKAAKLMAHKLDK